MASLCFYRIGHGIAAAAALFLIGASTTTASANDAATLSTAGPPQMVYILDAAPVDMLASPVFERRHLQHAVADRDVFARERARDALRGKQRANWGPSLPREIAWTRGPYLRC